MSMSARIAVASFDDRTVRVVLVRTGGKVPFISEAHAVEARYTDPEHREAAMATAVADAVGAVKGPVSAWVLCASSAFAITRLMRIPFKGRGKVAAVVPGELEPYLAIPIDELVVDHAIVRESEGKTDVLAVAARESMLASQLDMLRSAGVNVEAITLDVAAVTSLWRSTRKTTAPLEAVLHVRETDSLFVIVTPKALVWYRSVPLTLEHLRANPESAVQHVRNSIRAFQASWEGGAELDSLTVTGPALGDEIRTPLEEGLGMAVKVEDLMMDVRGVEKISEAGQLPEEGAESDGALWGQLDVAVDRYAPLVGAALALTGKGYRFNLMQGGLRSGQSNKNLVSHLVFSGALALAALVAYGAFCFADYRATMRRVDQIGNEIWAIHQQCFPNSEMTERPAGDTGGRITYDALESQAMNGVEGPLANVPIEWLTKPMLLEILKDLGEGLPSETVNVTSVKLGAGRGEDIITVMGTFDTANLQAFNSAVDELKRDSAIFANAQDPRLQTSNAQVTFTLVAPY